MVKLRVLAQAQQDALEAALRTRASRRQTRSTFKIEMTVQYLQAFSSVEGSA